MVLYSLVKKEFYQIIRDPSSILIAFILPAILLVIYMYGINLDTTKVSIGVVNEDVQPATQSLVDSFDKSIYIDVCHYEHRQEAYDALRDSYLRGIVVIPMDFGRRLQNGTQGQIQVITDGSESNTANFVYNYTAAIITQLYEARYASNNLEQPLVLENVYWYNAEINSHHSIVPGSLAITMTLIGILLTGLVVAREWERGTMESLLAAGVSPLNLVLGKYIPYYVLGMASLFFNVFLCVVVFAIPFRGSLLSLFFFSTFFLLSCLGVGLLISTKMRSQFLAGEMAFVIGFLPSLLLCGLMFPIQSMPAFFRYLTQIIPARYYVLLLQNEFLVGTGRQLVLENSLYLSVLSLGLFTLVYLCTPKRL